MNPKYSTVFFSVSIMLVSMLFLIGAPMMTLFESQQDNDDYKERLLVEETVTIPSESKPTDQTNCTELNQFIISFEKGWGSAIPLYNEKCP